MNAHDTDTTGEDRFLRLLDDEGARWRAGYQPPSFDDAVRRLGLSSEAPAGPRVRRIGARGRGPGWWRPLAVAAAVLVLVGGAVGVLSTARRAQHPTPAAPSSATTTSATTTSTGAATSAATATTGPLPGLTMLPAGFAYWPHEVRQYSAGSGASGVVTSRPLPEGEKERLYTRGGVADEREGIVLDVLTPGAEHLQPNVVVRGRPAQLVREACGATPGCTRIIVVWVEASGSRVQVRYDGPPAGSSPAPLTVDQVLTAARSFEPHS